MLKKILIIIGLFIVSTLTYLFVGSYIYNVEEIKYVKSLIEEEEYLEAYKYSGNIICEDSLYEEEIDDMVLHAYKTVSLYEEEDRIRIYEGVDFVLYNVNKDFSNVTKVIGLYNDEEYELKSGIYSEFMYAEFNIYSCSLEISDSAYLNEVIFYSNDEEVYSFEVESIFLGFDSEEKALWDDYIFRYNELVSDYTETGKYDTDVYEELNSIYSENLENSSFALKKYSTAISETTGFTVKIAILMIIILICNIACGYFFLVRKKKDNKYQIVNKKEIKEIKETNDATEVELVDNKENKEK